MDLPELHPGSRWAQYGIVREIGRGGFSVVYEAEDRLLHRRVALKVLGGDKYDSRQRQQAFLSEAQSAARLISPYIVVLLEADLHRGHPFLAFEYMPRGDLKAELASNGPLDPDRACFLLGQIALALQELHEAGLKHRDIKPSNCFLDRNGNAKLGDLGLARGSLEQGLDGSNEARVIFGTPTYMAPEQILGTTDIRSDIYSLGATFYELLCGEPPYDGPDAQAVAAQVLAGPPPPLAERAPQLPLCLVDLIEHMMARETQARFDEPAEIVELLREMGPLDLSPRTTRRAHRQEHRTTSAHRPRTDRWGRLAGHPLSTWGLLGLGLITAVWLLRQTNPLQPSQLAIEADRRAATETSDPPTPVHTVPLTAERPDTATGAALEATRRSQDGVTVAPLAADRDEDTTAATNAPSSVPPHDRLRRGQDQHGDWLDCRLDARWHRFRPVHDRQGRLLVWLAERECDRALWAAMRDNAVAGDEAAGQPITQISWQQAVDACAALAARLPELQLRLPRVAEWRQAAHRLLGSAEPPLDCHDNLADQDSVFPWRLRRWRDDHPHGPAPVAHHPVGVGGLANLAGNVAEWCLPDRAPDGAPDGTPSGPADVAARPYCGGSWADDWHRSRQQRVLAAGDATTTIGFRLAIAPQSPALAGRPPLEQP